MLSSIRSDIFLKSFFSLTVRVFSALSAFVVSVFIGRELGSNDSGYFFLSFSIITFLSAFVRVGLDGTILKFTGVSYPKGDFYNVRLILLKGIVISFVPSVFAVLLLFFFSDSIAVYIFGKPDLSPILKYMSVGIFFIALINLMAMSLQGMQHVVPSVFIMNILANLVLLVFIFFDGGVSKEMVAIYFSASVVLTTFLGFFIWLFFYRKNDFFSVDKNSGITSWNNIFKSCFPLWVVMIMGQLTQWSGQFYAGVYTSSSDVAMLAVSQRIAMLASFILIAVNMVVAPKFAYLFDKEDLESIKKMSIISVRMMLIFSLPIIIGMVVFPEYLLLFFGKSFVDGAQLLQILAIGQFVNVLTGSVSILLAMSGHERDLRNCMLISGIFSVIVPITLVPFYGVVGAAISTALSVALQNLLVVFFVKKRLGFNTISIFN